MHVFRSRKNHNNAANNHGQYKKAGRKTSLFRRKSNGPQEKPGVDDNETTSDSLLGAASTSEESTGTAKQVTIISASDESDSVWSRAYDSLKEKDAALVKRYEEILSKEYFSPCSQEDMPSNVIAQNDHRKRKLQMDDMMRKGQQRIEKSRTKCRTLTWGGAASTANAVLATRDWVGQALKNSDEASLIWAGVSLIIQLVTNPITAHDSNMEGFLYVTERLGFYNEFQTRWIPQVPDGLRKSFEKSVQDLYESILEFQLLSVIRFYRSSIRNFGGDIFQPKRWDELLLRVKERESIVAQDSAQIRGSASYDLQEKNLKFNMEMAERQMTKNEWDCLQLFRLTHTTGSGAGLEGKFTYEDFKDRVEHKVEGTCQWFLDQESFKRWLKEDSGILLVTADPGCGKSVLAKYLIDCELPQHANESGKPPVICYFFFKEQVQSHISTALCALIHQLFSQRPSLIKHAIEAVERNGSKLIDVSEKLWEILQKATKDEDAGQIIFVLDALDECDRYDRQRLVSFLKGHFQRAPTARGKLRILLTSRPYGEITYDFDDAFPNMRIPGEDESPRIAEEINAVIKYRVRRFQRSRGLKGDTIDSLEKRLMGIKHRTYLWLYLVFDYLENELVKLTEKEMQKRVFDSVPISFDDAYEKILEKSKDKERALKVFKILLAAYRPLTVGEMQIALETERASSSLEDLDLESADAFKRNLREYCGLFVSIDNGIVYFLHQTAREFLLPKSRSTISNGIAELSLPTFRHSVSIEQAHASIAESCMAYVKFPEWLEDRQHDNRVSVDPEIPDQDEHELSFLRYASTYWAIHLQLGGNTTDEELQGDAFELCHVQSTDFYPWFHTHWEQTQNGRLEKPSSTLAISSYFGLEYVAKQLLTRNGVDGNSMNDFDKNSLLWAAERGHESVVKLLLQTGKVDLNLKDTEFGKTPLAYAAENGHKVIAELFLGTGKVDPNLDSKEGWTPLAYAAKNGHDAIVKLLLGTGKVDAESITKDKYGMTPIAIAAAAGHEKVVKFLLQNANVDPNPRAKDGWTPLIYAAYEGHLDVAKLLLKSEKIDIDYKGPYSITALKSAAWNQQLEVMKLLIETGKVDLDCEDDHRVSLLSSAAYDGYTDVVNLLLETGKVNLQSETNRGETALTHAAENGSKEVVKRLLETGEFDPDHRTLRGATPLMRAAYRGKCTAMKLLLETGKVDPNTKDQWGRTALMEAARCGRDEAVELLLEAGEVDLDSKDIDGWTPLRHAAEGGYQKAVELLLATGKVDAMSTANDGDSPLSAATRKGHRAIVELLRSYKPRQLQVIQEWTIV
ncbi:hypothetical protein BC1G_06991 [Paecilomyces variotii No. 5]|uniref:NACHT domain-containing protein n=1 Tax=Byssochlamys spectabilis (strain No. 5 / NBRC 109023) TaxID=1356009 RepID=V5FB61_BYSSN|nr:hypothetical protein BC1G_06991 [Paecilomyces variotii No. 5]